VSNYPDGMRESDIPGWWDTESVKVCVSEKQVHVVPLSLFDSLQELLMEVSAMKDAEFPEIRPYLKDLFNRLRSLLSEITIGGETLECAFDDEVIVDSDGWDCPVCETHYDHPEYEG